MSWWQVVLVVAAYVAVGSMMLFFAFCVLLAILAGVCEYVEMFQEWRRDRSYR